MNYYEDFIKKFFELTSTLASEVIEKKVRGLENDEFFFTTIDFWMSDLARAQSVEESRPGTGGSREGWTKIKTKIAKFSFQCQNNKKIREMLLDKILDLSRLTEFGKEEYLLRSQEGLKLENEDNLEHASNKKVEQ